MLSPFQPCVAVRSALVSSAMGESSTLQIWCCRVPFYFHFSCSQQSPSVPQGHEDRAHTIWFLQYTSILVRVAEGHWLWTPPTKDFLPKVPGDRDILTDIQLINGWGYSAQTGHKTDMSSSCTWFCFNHTTLFFTKVLEKLGDLVPQLFLRSVKNLSCNL